MSEIPEWMEEDAKAHQRESMIKYPGLWITAARFAASAGHDRSESLALIMAASDVRRAQTLSHWKAEVQSFDQADLRRNGKSRIDNPDKPAITFYLNAAMARLLELIEAPSSLAETLQCRLRSGQPVDAHKRAKLQAILIRRRCERLSERQLAKLAKCDRKLVSRYLKDGTIRRVP